MSCVSESLKLTFGLLEGVASFCEVPMEGQVVESKVKYPTFKL